MSNVIHLHLPSEIEQSLTTFAQQVIAQPNQFILNDEIFKTEDAPLYDIHDDNIPALSDHFILNHNLNSVTWKEPNDLHTNALSWLYKLSFPPVKTCVRLFECLEDTVQLNLTQHRGNFLYPQGGFMGWHTNSDFPGTRVYVAYSTAERGSYFKYVDRTNQDNPNIITDWDNAGWTVRIFCPSNIPSEYLWHCVGAPNATRMSFGFLLK